MVFWQKLSHHAIASAQAGARSLIQVALTRAMVDAAHRRW